MEIICEPNEQWWDKLRECATEHRLASDTRTRFALDMAMTQLARASVAAVFRHNLAEFDQIDQRLLQPVILKAAEWAKLEEQHDAASRWRKILEKIIESFNRAKRLNSKEEIKCLDRAISSELKKLKAQIKREEAEPRPLPEPDNANGPGQELWRNANLKF